MDKHQLSTELLEKYAKGQCNAEERAIVERWLEAPHTIISEQQVFQDTNKEAVRQHIWKGLAPKKITKQRIYPWRHWAALLFLLLAASILWYAGLPDFLSRKEKASTERSLEAARGKKLQVILPDGTKVHLNSESSIRYPIPFEKRHIHLSGEAHFDVVNNSKEPFVVITTQGSIMVLGTSFNVQSYPADTCTQVTVLTGKVRCIDHSRQSSADLQQNEALTITKNQLTAVQQVNAARYTLWTEQVLYFDDEPLKMVAQKLERWYDVRIHLQDPAFVNEIYRGRFINPPLHQILNSLAFGLGFRYQQKGRDVYIFKN